MGTLENHLSVVTLKALFFSLSLIFAGLTIITTLAQSFEIAFHVYAIISLIFSVALLAASILIVRPWFSHVEKKDYRVLAGILAIGVAGALLALFINVHDTDDYYYIPNAIYHLMHPDKPMDYYIYYVWSGAKPFHSFTQATAVSYEYFQSIFAYFFHIPYLICYYMISPAFIGFLIPLAYFLALSYFSDRSDDAVIGAMVVLGLMVLLGETRYNLAHYSLARIYQGRSVLLTLAPPLFAAASLAYFARSNFINWLTLFCITTLFTRLSTTAILFLPVLAFGLSVSFLSIDRSRTAIWILIKYFLSLAFLFFWMFYILDESRSLVGAATDALPINSFGGNAMLLINKHMPLFPIFAAVSSLLSVLLTSGKRKIFLAAWMISTVLLFFNRVVGPFWVHQLSSPYFNNVYWRLFFAYPFPLTAGITTMRLFDRSKIIQARGRLGPAFALAAIIVVAVIAAPGSIFKYQYARIRCCEFKMIPEVLATSREVVSSVPSGVMLAPRVYSGMIATLDPEFQQLITYKDALRLWLDQQGRTQEAATRIRAMEFLEGSTNDLSQLQTAIEKYPVMRSIFFNRATFENKEVDLLLQKYGFIHHKAFGNYVVVWKDLG